MALFSIRPMTEADVPAVILVENQIYEFPWTDRNFLDSLRAGYHMHCMWLDEQLAGYIVMMHVVDEFHLLNISIRTDLQGYGHGKHLLEWGIGQAKMANATGMLLEVRPSNTSAKALYEKEGFKLIGARKNYYPSHMGREDALVMLKKFTGSLE
ncbi:ribosomal protein S18-alanine N-acetyltransferase [Limnobacter parvus]|uniref:[Ribosomal protein bS18]-alanine N-acetyltransferase n=1 Tax=Limnobacter parvus TaxID=2939690 RepID=A0ABT1XJU8_9BURK|nr:ribosomal protein S18-alanine N-acetyltransferase [Limnobacter parvus]MCR2747563.1 ribosomal protein S18-alanine N-acetyltransferase [Limnobacter parvus]